MNGPLIAEVAFQGKRKFIVYLRVHLVVIAQQLGALAFHSSDGVVYDALVGYNAYLLSIYHYRVTGGIKSG